MTHAVLDLPGCDHKLYSPLHGSPPDPPVPGHRPDGVAAPLPDLQLLVDGWPAVLLPGGARPPGRVSEEGEQTRGEAQGVQQLVLGEVVLYCY